MLRRFFRVPVYLYRWKCGWLLGHRFLLLIHVGRRTGQPRNTVLEVLEYRKEGPEAVVMSAFGRDADWFRNIEATPNSEVIIGSQRFIAVHRLLDEDEAVSVITGYELRNWLIAPIVRWVLSRLLGWRYDGEMDQRRRLIAQLPCVAFHPATMLGGPAQPPIRSFGLQSAGAGGAAIRGQPVASNPVVVVLEMDFDVGSRRGLPSREPGWPR